MKVIAIIPCMRPDGLKVLLNSFAAASVPETLKVVIIVVNNQSDAIERQRIKDISKQNGMTIKHVLAETPGQAHAMNEGLKNAIEYEYDWVYFCDDDQKVDSSLWYIFIKACKQHPDAAGFFGPYLPMHQIKYPFFLKNEELSMISIMANMPVRPIELQNPYACWGGNMFLSATAIQKVGAYFNATPYQSQDTDMAYRLLTAGYKLMFIPDLVIYHEVDIKRCTISYLQKRSYRTGTITRYFDHQYRTTQNGRHLFGVPLYLYRKAFAVDWSHSPYVLTRFWLNLCYLFGYFRGH